jgi:RNase H-fold protein (predicted Holliday junction resolvase)
MAKIKSSWALRLSVQHNTRERIPENADPKKTPENQTAGGSSDEVIKLYNSNLPGKIRKNAVHAVEVVMTASPEFSGDWESYCGACNAWAVKLFGEKNLLSTAVHLDEKTPHVHAVFMPLKDGKLNAAHFIGGSKNRLQQLQNDFYENVGKRFGLERGRSRSETKSRHAPHTLAGRTAELDEREKTVNAREKFLEKVVKEQEQKINRAAAAVEEREKAVNEKIAAMEITEASQNFQKYFDVVFSNSTKHKAPEFKKRVYDYAVKKLPEHFQSCSLAVLQDRDILIQKNGRSVSGVSHNV